MPIRRELRHLYTGPAWREVRARILVRASGRCERCGAPNHTRVARYDAQPGWGYGYDDGAVYSPEGPRPHRVRGSEMPAPDRVVVIVLTIAHLNHDARDNRDENLAALCQACHNAHDAGFRAANARGTRQRTKDAARPLLAMMGRVNPSAARK